VFNLSFSEGSFPDHLKQAKVIPIFKKGDTMIFSNYRPISVLSIFSKILEKLMYNRLIEYIKTHNILFKNQFGFREGHSTEQALMLLTSNLYQALDKGNYAIGLFLDFSKAFDTIDHSILLQKLSHYGIRGIAANWVTSYLHNRKQVVTYNGVTSQECTVKCGVPQGSILGPLLFLLYINDLANICSKTFALLFVDDTNIFITGKNLHEIVSTLNEELKRISEWLKINKLSLNIDKTLFMVFSNKKNNGSSISIKIDDKEIQQTNNTKFLGVTIDSQLEWKTHIQHVANQVSKCSGILSKTKHLLSKNTLMSLYYTLAYPYLTYCNHVWGCIQNSNLIKLVLLQKRIIRIICKTDYLSHTTKRFADCQLLKFLDINKLLIGTFMYKYKHNMLPFCFINMFPWNN
jgi:hypothetical protein